MPLLAPREVKTITVGMVATSATRTAALSPTTGTRIRIISIGIAAHALTTDPGRISVYFGTGANIGTNAGNEIAENRRAVIDITDRIVFNSEDGPVGAVDAVVSVRTSATLTNGTALIITYRQE